MVSGISLFDCCFRQKPKGTQGETQAQHANLSEHLKTSANANAAAEGALLPLSRRMWTQLTKLPAESGDGDVHRFLNAVSHACDRACKEGASEAVEAVGGALRQLQTACLPSNLYHVLKSAYLTIQSREKPGTDLTALKDLLKTAQDQVAPDESTVSQYDQTPFKTSQELAQEAKKHSRVAWTRLVVLGGVFLAAGFAVAAALSYPAQFPPNALQFQSNPLSGARIQPMVHSEVLWLDQSDQIRDCRDKLVQRFDEYQKDILEAKARFDGQILAVTKSYDAKLGRCNAQLETCNVQRQAYNMQMKLRDDQMETYKIGQDLCADLKNLLERPRVATPASQVRNNIAPLTCWYEMEGMVTLLREDYISAGLKVMNRRTEGVSVDEIVRRQKIVVDELTEKWQNGPDQACYKGVTELTYNKHTMNEFVMKMSTWIGRLEKLREIDGLIRNNQMEDALEQILELFKECPAESSLFEQHAPDFFVDSCIQKKEFARARRLADQYRDSGIWTHKEHEHSKLLTKIAEKEKQWSLVSDLHPEILKTEDEGSVPLGAVVEARDGVEGEAEIQAG